MWPGAYIYTTWMPQMVFIFLKGYTFFKVNYIIETSAWPTKSQILLYDLYIKLPTLIEKVTTKQLENALLKQATLRPGTKDIYSLVQFSLEKSK